MMKDNINIEIDYSVEFDGMSFLSVAETRRIVARALDATSIERKQLKFKLMKNIIDQVAELT